jgi:hypothetical protein
LRDIPFVVLNPLLVTSELVLNLVDALIHRRLGGGARFSGYEIMLVLGRDQDLHIPSLLPLIHRDLDGHEATEVFE